MVVPSTAVAWMLIGAGLPSGPEPGSTATEPVEAIRLDIQQTSSCTELEGFWDQVRARTDRVREAAPGEAGRLFSASADKLRTKAKGRLVITEPDGRQTVRELDASSCEEVVTGLALIAAIAIDPDARTDPLPEKPPPPPEKKPPPPKPKPPPPPPPPQEPEEPTNAVAFGGTAHFMSGAPVIVGGFGALEWDLAPTRVVAPILRVAGFGEFAPTVVRTPEGAARFQWLGGRVDVCPLRLPRRSAAHLDICTRVEAGAIRGQGFDTYQGETAFRLWAGVGAALRGRVQLGRTFFLEAEGAAEISLAKPAFLFRPGTLVLEVTPVVGTGALGAGARF